MFSRPTREATAKSVGDPSAAIVHRNELNEQQRPGGLVLFPQAFAPAKGEKAAPRWIPKLMRRMAISGADGSSVDGDGLLMYSGMYIKVNNLDKNNLIPAALKTKDVLFTTNHIDVSPMRGNASTMIGIPVRAGSAPTTAAPASVKPVARRRRVRFTKPKQRAAAGPDVLPSLIDVRSGADLGPGLDDDASDEASEQDESFKFGGYVTFSFVTKRGVERAAAVTAFTACTSDNIDTVEALLPEALWAQQLRPEDTLLPMACPWGSPIIASMPLKHMMIITGGEYDGEPIRGFYDAVSGFGEGCEFTGADGKAQLGIPRGIADGVLRVLPLRKRVSLAHVPNAAPILALAREHRPWLRHQHEVALDVAAPLQLVPLPAVVRPIYITAPGGVPFQLNHTPSEVTYVTETAVVCGAESGAPPRLAALHPPSLSARMRGVARWLAPARARTLQLAQKAIRRHVFAKVARLRDETRVSVLKIEIFEFGQERAAALDVWPVLDVSNMDDAELSYLFEDGVDSVNDTIGFMGGMHPKEIGFFVFQHHEKNEIAYSPVHDVLRLTLHVRWYDNAGDWRAGAPETPEDASLQYSLVNDKWVTEDELSRESLDDRKRKFGVFVDTLYK
jgi:hypothetical protein